MTDNNKASPTEEPSAQDKTSINGNTKLEHVIQGASLGYWDWNYQTGIHHVSDLWLAILGLNRKDEKRHESDWSSRINADDFQRIMPIIQQHIKTGETYVVEFRMKHKEGHWVWIQGSGSVIEYDQDNKPLRLCGTHQDISSRKLLEEERDQLINSLQEALDEIKTLKGIIPICSYCHNIRDDEGSWDKIESYISRHSDAQFSHGICPSCLDDVSADIHKK